MSKPKPQTVQTPYQGQTTNTFGTFSIADTPEAKAYLAEPLDIDPGAGRRGDLQEQEMTNRWNSAFTAGIPQHLKMQLQEGERRAIAGQNTAEMQQADYVKKMMDLERRRTLLPQMVQTGGSTSGFNTQAFQPQGSGFWGGLASAGLSMVPKI